jgi:hypothetical protein
MAPRGKTVQLDHMYVADFETCDAEKEYKVDKESGKMIMQQKVWLAGFKNLETLKSTYFYNLDDFMEAILSRGDNQNTEYAFHNLKFDGSYIVPWLLNNNYECVTDRKPEAKEFSILVDERNAWYTINIQVTNRRRVLLWDSLKLFPCALEYLPDVYSTPTHKIQEDSEFYETVRPDGYKPNEREMMYFENDLQVPAEALNKHIELFGLRFKKTQAGQAFYNFEQVFKAWKWRFPPLTTEQHETIKRAYWGGISYVPPSKAGKDFYNIGVFDINSSYPDKAANYKLPYGKCLFEYGEGIHPDMSKFWVAQCLVKFKLKKDCLPCIPYKAISEGGVLEEKDEEHDKWLEESKGIVRLTLCCIDYATIQESYEEFTVIEWLWSMHWAWKKHREVAKFVNMNNDNKIKYSKLAKTVTISDPKYAEWMTKRNRAKIDNNAFYGKFGEEIIKKGKTPYLEDGDIVWRLDREDETSEGKRKFLPVAIAITAWGRRQLVQGWNVLGDHALYCDTDSLHYLKEGQSKLDQAQKEGHFEIDSEKLGAWKLEGNMKRGRYLRAKCYMEENEKGELEATVAGLPSDKHTGQFSKKRSCLNWDNFHLGTIITSDKTNKLRTVRTPTGNKLLPVHFQIQDKEKIFEPTQEQLETSFNKWVNSLEVDTIKDAVKQHGYIETVKQGQQYYEEYKELSRSVKSKYFRKKGLPLDVFADNIHMDVNELISHMQ